MSSKRSRSLPTLKLLLQLSPGPTTETGCPLGLTPLPAWRFRCCIARGGSPGSISPLRLGEHAQTPSALKTRGMMGTKASTKSRRRLLPSRGSLRARWVGGKSPHRRQLGWADSARAVEGGPRMPTAPRLPPSTVFRLPSVLSSPVASLCHQLAKGLVGLPAVPPLLGLCWKWLQRSRLRPDVTGPLSSPQRLPPTLMLP
mmetsp:Transcript_26338/g.69904  ORF Transcript_26338/g.69904 Transcript_26338/m.69904 type:complete len:200 (-) Transcript_26338:295-894(-)